MRTAIALVLVACLGCKNSTQPEQQGSGIVTGSGSGSGSDAEKPKTTEEIAKRFEECWKFWSDGRFDQYRGCYASDAIGDSPGIDATLKNPDAIVGAVREERTAFPDLKGQVKIGILSGHTAISMLSLGGTNTGPLPGGRPPSHKKFGVTLVVVGELDGQGRTKHESIYVDNATLLAQIGLMPVPAAGLRPIPEITPGPAQALITKDDATERANRDTVVRL